MVRLVLTLLATTIPFCLSGQVGGWETLYADNSTGVEVEIRITRKGDCLSGVTHNYQFAYRLYNPRSVTTFIAWKMDFLDCDGYLYTQERSLELGLHDATKRRVIEGSTFMFSGTNVLRPFYNAFESRVRRDYTTRITIANSVAATSISGPRTIVSGQQATLNVQGGVLGTSADWHWYEGDCGDNPVGTGPSIVVTPNDTTTYFVRAEGSGNITGCTTFTINVDPRSLAPRAIAADDDICAGTTALMTVKGGTLGIGAEWVWYEGDCNGFSIGTGRSITVRPTTSTTYFVRAESSYNITSCASATINVLQNNTKPIGIEAIGSTSICQGRVVKLRATSFQGPSDKVKWFSNSCLGSMIATGAEVEFTPQSTTTYYARMELPCNTTTCASITIVVYDKSVPPTQVFLSPSQSFKNQDVTLSVNGGYLGKDANWLWFREGCGISAVGSGTSVTVRTKVPTTYFVKAVGACNDTYCAEAVITPLKKHHWEKNYASQYRKFMGWGFGVGGEWMGFEGLARNRKTSNGTVTQAQRNISLSGLGLKGELSFHPLIKDYVSLGLITGFAVGALPTTGSSDMATTSREETFSYKRVEMETEAVLGLTKIKLLGKFKRSFQVNDYKKTVTSIGSGSSMVETFNEDIKRETLSLGLRLGSYYGKSPTFKSNNFDIVYAISRPVSRLPRITKGIYSDLPKWHVGMSFLYWRQNSLKLQFDIFLKSTKNDFRFTSSQFSKGTYVLSLILSRSQFY